MGWPWPPDLDSDFAKLNVSRETSRRLCAYVTLLEQWNRAINLVSAGSIQDVWRRHILDSAQLCASLPANAMTIVDLGSGGGLPGIVLACLTEAHVHMIEADRRKAIFLSESIRVLDLNATIHRARIDRGPEISADIITARALAPVTKLLDYSMRFCAPTTQCLFLKSQDVACELTEATKHWRFEATQTPSVSDRRGIVLRICNVERR